jgi:hypothetical protein
LLPWKSRLAFIAADPELLESCLYAAAFELGVLASGGKLPRWIATETKLEVPGVGIWEVEHVMTLKPSARDATAIEAERYLDKCNCEPEHSYKCSLHREQ